MIDSRLFEELRERIDEALRDSPAQDLEKNLRALLAAWFERLDLVLREDFEVQKKLLERAQAKLAELEARIAELEARKPPSKPERRSPSVPCSMTVATVASRALAGIDAPEVTVEVHLGPACRRSTSSACPTPRCAKRATACARRSTTRISSFPRAASP